MALSNTDLVTELYVGYFNRAPDEAGMTSWLSALNSGAVTVAQVAILFANSTEAVNFTSMTADAVVQAVYSNVLNRAPDAAGEAFWVSQLNAGNVTTGGLILAVENTVNLQTGTNDAITLQGKVTAGEYAYRIAGDFSANVGDPVAFAHSVMAPLTGHSPVTAADIEASKEIVDTAYVPADPAPAVSVVGISHAIVHHG